MDSQKSILNTIYSHTSSSRLELIVGLCTFYENEMDFFYLRVI